MHTATKNTDVSLSLKFQKHLSNELRKHGILVHGKHKKTSSKQKWTNNYYYVQHHKYVKHHDVNIYCGSNYFPELQFLGPQNNLHNLCGLGKHSHTSFIPN